MTLVLRLMLHPVTIMASILLGGLWGWVDQGQSQTLDQIGVVYVRLLQMCVIPLLLTAVVVSLSKLLASHSAAQYVGKMIGVFLFGLVLAAIVGVSLGVLGEPGSGIQDTARQTIGEVIFQSESASTGDGSQNVGISDILVRIVPENIFTALTGGDKLAILFFSIVFGIALGSIGLEQASSTIKVVETLYEAFIKIIEWLMYVLPIGLFCLAYAQISAIGIEVLISMLQLVALIYVGAIFMIILAGLLIWYSVGGPFWRAFSAMRESMFVAFGTSSGFAAVPSALRGLKEKLGIDKNVVDLIMPLGITLNPPGSVFHFSIATIFLVNLYGLDITFGQTVFIVFASILAGVAASGAPGIAALTMIGIILVPLGLPVEVAVILLVAIDPIVDPILTVLNVHANSAATSWLGAKTRKPDGQISDPFLGDAS